MDSFRLALTENNLRLQKILLSNHRKQQVTALVHNEKNALFIAKWRANGADNERENLGKEAQFYVDRPYPEFIPCANNLVENLLLIEFIPSSTLRTFLVTLDIGNPEAIERAASVIRDVFRFFREAYSYNTFHISAESYGLLPEYIQRLCCSGPSDSPRYPIENRLNSVLSLAYKRKFRALARDLPVVEYSPVVIHGDLHLDNILVPSDGSAIKIIDWENVRKASPVLDFLYCTSMIRALLPPHPRLQQHLETQIEQAFPEMPATSRNINRQLLAIFESLIATNSRFQRMSSWKRWRLGWKGAWALLR